MQHQYIERQTGIIKTEPLIQDKMINFIYSSAREYIPVLFNALTSARMSSLLGYINFDAPILSQITGTKSFVKKLNIDLDECADSLENLNTPRKLFERKIEYWKYRPMETGLEVVVSPADAKVLVGSFSSTSALKLKDKFFIFEELIGSKYQNWLNIFKDGDFAIFRLTPEKYHYNHCPVSGVVTDIYSLDGAYNSCNPNAVVALITPYSKNQRIVTIIDTDVEGGSQVGYIAMVEVVAMMIGDVVQCYSDIKYDNPQWVKPGLFVKKGQPKSLYRPGSSTDVIIFEPNRIQFETDLVANLYRTGTSSRFSMGFGQPLLETDLQVRSSIARRKDISNIGENV